MDKTKGELLQEELLFKQENGTTRLSDEEIDKAYAFAEDYKKFMDAAKIEIEAVKEAIKLLEANGYHEFERGRNTCRAKDSTTITAVNLSSSAPWVHVQSKKA